MRRHGSHHRDRTLRRPRARHRRAAGRRHTGLGAQTGRQGPDRARGARGRRGRGLPRPGRTRTPAPDSSTPARSATRASSRGWRRRRSRRSTGLAPDTVLLSFLAPHRNVDDRPRPRRERKVSTLAMDLVPRITRAQSIDALSSQANVAGYRAVVEAAYHLDKYFPLFMTAAGTIRPARIVVLGAGVAGLQAVATAKRLGAVVHVSDIREAAREEVGLARRHLHRGARGRGRHRRGRLRQGGRRELPRTPARRADRVPLAGATPRSRRRRSPAGRHPS